MAPSERAGCQPMSCTWALYVMPPSTEEPRESDRASMRLARPVVPRRTTLESESEQPEVSPTSWTWAV